MDYLLTGIVIALICLAAWLFYKRWTGRYRSAPAVDDYEEAEDDEPEEPAKKADSSPPEPIPEENE